MTSDEADLIITVDNGTQHRIVLDGVTDIGGVISAINDFGQVTASRTVDDPPFGLGDATPVNEANTGLTLKDNTAGGTPTGNFMVARANGSVAGVQLGIIGMDANPQDPADDPDATIVGETIAGASVLDRFFIEGLPNLNNVINASLSVTPGAVLSDIEITAKAGGITTITANGFDFTLLDAAAVTAGDIDIGIKGVAGFTQDTFTIDEVVDDTTVKLAGDLGGVGLVGGAGILRNGIQASANFGFVGVELTGTGSLAPIRRLRR